MRAEYLIIGNSAGGIGAIEAIREVDSDADIVVVSEERKTYSKALIPYYIAGDIDLEGIYFRDEDFYKKNNVHAILGEKAVRIDFKGKEVYLERGSRIKYGKLLLATGSEPSIPPIEGLLSEGRFKDGVFTFTTLNDAIEINERIKRGVENAIVLGGGRIGLMAAEALFKRGIPVAVVKRSPKIFPEVFDENASRLVARQLEENGLQMLVGRTIKEVRGGSCIERVVLDDGSELRCDLLIVATGVRPRLELVRHSEVKTRRGIVVDRKMRTSVADVYACGDCAEVYDFIHNEFRLTPLWTTAYLGGRIAGFNMCGCEREFAGMSMNAMHFFNLPVFAAGISNVECGEDDRYEILSAMEEEKKRYKKIILRDNHVVGILFVNNINKAGVYLGLMRSCMDVSLFKEELMSDDFSLIDIPEELRRGILG